MKYKSHSQSREGEMKDIAKEAIMSYDGGIAENAEQSVENLAEAFGVFLEVLINKNVIMKTEASDILSAPMSSLVTLEED